MTVKIRKSVERSVSVLVSRRMKGCLRGLKLRKKHRRACPRMRMGRRIRMTKKMSGLLRYVRKLKIFWRE